MSPSRRAALALAAPAALALVLSAAPARPDPRFAPPPPPERAVRVESPAPPVAWRDPAAALAEARAEHKIVLLAVEVTWSAWCARMRRTTYADPGVREDIARDFVPARLDAEEDRKRVLYDGRTLSHRALADHFRVSTYPTIVFLAPDGAPITRVPGYVAPERFRTLLRFVAEGQYKKTTWEEFAGPPPPEPDAEQEQQP